MLGERARRGRNRVVPPLPNQAQVSVSEHPEQLVLDRLTVTRRYPDGKCTGARAARSVWKLSLVLTAITTTKATKASTASGVTTRTYILKNPEGSALMSPGSSGAACPGRPARRSASSRAYSAFTA